MLHYDWLSPSVVTYPPTPPSKKIQTGNTSREPFLPSLSLFFNKAKASDSNENKTVKVQKQNTRVTNSKRCHLVCTQVKWKTNYTHLHTPGFTTTYTSMAESQSYHACICTPQLTSSTWTACTQSASLILQFKHITTHHQCQRHPQGCRHMAAAVTDSDKPQLNSTVPTGMLVDRTPDPWTLPSPQSCPMAVGMKGGGRGLRERLKTGKVSGLPPAGLDSNLDTMSKEIQMQQKKEASKSHKHAYMVKLL